MRFYEPSPEQYAGYLEWVASRPEHVRKVATRFEPWKLYRMKSTGQRVVVYSFADADPVTLTVGVLAEFNLLAMERRVFGIDPDDLEECDLPGSDEIVGAAMTQEEVHDNIDQLRVEVRPDLWKMGKDGKARRRR